MLSHGENPESLSHLGLNRYRVVTDGRTDRIPIANTRSAVPAGPAVVRKNLYQNLTGLKSDLRVRKVTFYLFTDVFMFFAVVVFFFWHFIIIGILRLGNLIFVNSLSHLAFRIFSIAWQVLPLDLVLCDRLVGGTTIIVD